MASQRAVMSPEERTAKMKEICLTHWKEEFPNRDKFIENLKLKRDPRRNTEGIRVARDLFIDHFHELPIKLYLAGIRPTQAEMMDFHSGYLAGLARNHPEAAKNAPVVEEHLAWVVNTDPRLQAQVVKKGHWLATVAEGEGEKEEPVYLFEEMPPLPFQKPYHANELKGLAANAFRSQGLLGKAEIKHVAAIARGIIDQLDKHDVPAHVSDLATALVELNPHLPEGQVRGIVDHIATQKLAALQKRVHHIEEDLMEQVAGQTQVMPHSMEEELLKSEDRFGITQVKRMIQSVDDKVSKVQLKGRKPKVNAEQYAKFVDSQLLKLYRRSTDLEKLVRDLSAYFKQLNAEVVEFEKQGVRPDDFALTSRKIVIGKVGTMWAKLEEENVFRGKLNKAAKTGERDARRIPK